MTNYFKIFNIISILAITILSGCIPSAVIATPTTLPQLATTDIPSLKYQLTYVMSFTEDGIEYQGIFALDVQCLDKETLCFGPPEVLLKIPRQSGTNTLSPHGEISSYSWSPDGTRIAFSAFSIDGRIDIFVADWNGENLKNITMSPESERSPSWSVDNQLVYTACDGRCRTVISDENGNDTNTFPFNSVVVFATWMPDGRRILFIGADDKSVYQIYTANVNGSDVKQITHTIENNIVEGVSTNGELIFFTRSQTYADNNFNTNIFSIDIEGNLENIITVDKQLFSFHPSVAPFGRWLALGQGRDTYDIYVASFDGKQIFQVTEGEGDKSIPEWRVVLDP